MSRRVKVPAADELFRPTIVTEGTAAEAVAEVAPEAAATPSDPQGRSASGRVRHDEKMTVYLTAEELLDLEHARLTLRRAGVGVDRGRLVRTAIAMALADLDEHGTDSALVQQLSTQ